MNAKHTPGPWKVDHLGKVRCSGDDGKGFIADPGDGRYYNSIPRDAEISRANARLIAAAPDQHREMLRFLPVLERAEAEPELWARLTDGLGIATLNAYRAAIAKAKGEPVEAAK